MARRKLTEQEISQVQTMAGFGMPVEQMAAILNWNKSDFEDSVKRDAALRHALSLGKAKSSFNARKTAYEMAVTERNPRMVEFWLKTQERFTVTDRVEHVGKDGEALEKLGPLERQRRVEQIKKLLEETE